VPKDAFSHPLSAITYTLLRNIGYCVHQTPLIVLKSRFLEGVWKVCIEEIVAGVEVPDGTDKARTTIMAI
jgi:hypothetical protein